MIKVFFPPNLISLISFCMYFLLWSSNKRLSWPKFYSADQLKVLLKWVRAKFRWIFAFFLKQIKGTIKPKPKPKGGSSSTILMEDETEETDPKINKTRSRNHHFLKMKKPSRHCRNKFKSSSSIKSSGQWNQSKTKGG